jgi:predicted DNA-binding protein YlxM (UPF0122 family)
MTQTTNKIVDAEMAKIARQEIHAAFNGLRELLEQIEMKLRTQDQDKFNSALLIGTLLLKTLEKDFMMTQLTDKKDVILSN